MAMARSWHCLETLVRAVTAAASPLFYIGQNRLVTVRVRAAAAGHNLVEKCHRSTICLRLNAAVPLQTVVDSVRLKAARRNNVPMRRYKDQSRLLKLFLGPSTL
jgi:hypothetical protein